MKVKANYKWFTLGIPTEVATIFLGRSYRSKGAIDANTGKYPEFNKFLNSTLWSFG